MTEFIRIPQKKMQSEFFRILIDHYFTDERAEQCAKIFTENSLDGIYSHGVNRFSRFVKYIKNRFIDVNAIPTLISATNGIEQWNGNLGPGPLNAFFCTNHIMEIAAKFGLACLGLANTNHWMRGGSYGWQAAQKGFVLIAWTNTYGNMPAWGAVDSRLGNNPLIIAVPYKDKAIVLDMAMTQFSYGKIEDYNAQGKSLPMAGGFNSDGNLTNNPKEILDSWRALPIGYWKGAGLALLLDILAAILSGGLSTHEISKQKSEFGVSQVFVAIDVTKLNNFPAIEKTIDDIIKNYLSSIPENDDAKIVYPGQRILETRKENIRQGIPVNKKTWDEIKAM